MHEEEVSLLNHFDDVRAKQGITEGGLSTVIFCGKVRGESDMTAALQTHRTIVESEVNLEEVNVTGILIGQGSTILHLLEGPSFSVLRILGQLAGHRDFTDSTNTIQSGTVVYSIEDRPKRFFPEWYSCVIQEAKSSSEEVTEESCKDIVFEVATRLLQIGDRLQSQQDQVIELSSYSDQIPGAKLIAALSISTVFFSLEEYVQFYHDPHHVDIASEQSWPLERLVNF